MDEPVLNAPSGPSGRRDAAEGARLSLAGRLSLLVVLLIAGAVIVQGFILYTVAADALLDLEKRRLSERLRVVQESFRPRFDVLRRNVVLMSEMPPVQGMIRADARGGMDRGSSSQDWRERLDAIFAALLKAQPSYRQIIYVGVDDGGREIARVERMGAAVQIVGMADLRRQGNMPYFQSATRLKPGDVQLSDIVLNENLDRPSDTPWLVLRASTPIFNERGTVSGVVVINVDAGLWLRDLQVRAGGTDNLYLTDSQGNYLLFPNAGKASPDGGAAAQLRRDLPQLASVLEDGGDEERTSIEGEYVLFATRIPFDAGNPSRFLVLAASSPKQALLASTLSMRTWSIAIVACMVLLGVGLAWLLVRPLVRLMASAQRLARGDMSSRIQVDPSAPSEIGRLAEAFHAMTDMVQDREMSLREAEATTQVILESAGNAILTVDKAGLVESANRAAEAMLGYVKDGMLGLHISAILPAAGAWAAEERVALRAGRSDSKARHADGHAIPVLCTVARVPLPDRDLHTVVITDLTEVKKADRVKDEFVSVVSHELRTPLTSIRGALGLVIGDAAGVLPAKARELVDIAHRNADRLVRLINDILDVQKLTAGGMEIELRPIEARMILRQAILANASYGERFGVGFDLDEPPTGLDILVDADRFMQIMANLLSNAAKFSPSGTRVEVSAATHGDTLRLFVQDHGSGIPAAIRPRIFEKFVQGDNSDSRRHDGTGLGLNITKQLVTAMGGTIAFETAEGMGTTFILDIPLATRAAMAAVAKVA